MAGMANLSDQPSNWTGWLGAEEEARCEAGVDSGYMMDASHRAVAAGGGVSMPRRRRVLSIALLLALLGAGGGYWLAHGQGPSYVLRTVTVGSLPGRVDVDAAIDRAFVVNFQDESVSVLDARSGTVLGAMTIGAVPAGVVPDVPTGRLIVLSNDDPTAPSVVLDAASGARVGTFSDLGMN
jgi:DNA-binding beta-propeller fold protein YncE